MKYVDYQKLAEQYASFLVAVGGVSITVLAVVLSLKPDSAEVPKPSEGDARSYLITALVVAALSCFIGAQMMAETAAFTNYTSPTKSANSPSMVKFITDTLPLKLIKVPEPDVPEPTKKADKLFLLASSNIFTAIILVFFALILLPLSSGKVHRASMKPVAWLFILMVAGATYWAVLAGNFRMPVAGGWFVTGGSLLIGAGWCFLFYRLTKKSRWLLWVIPDEEWGRIKIKEIIKTEVPEGSRKAEVAKVIAEVGSVYAKPKKKIGWISFKPIEKRWQLWLAFAPSALLTIITLARFAWIYKDGDEKTLLDATSSEGWIFSSYIAVSYASLIVASIQTMFGDKSKPEHTPEQKKCWEKVALYMSE